jgi:ABC-2 type transport system ATP-binding protein
MKQRLKLAQAIVHDPPILLLDEPTNGLDPQARRHMLELVHDLGHAQGKNLLLCSHLLLDVERTCADVIVLKQGRAVLQGSIAELTRSDGQRFRVRLAGDRDGFQSALAARGFECTAVGPADLSVRFPDAGADADPLFEIAGMQITELSPVRSSLEEIFLHELARESVG